MTPETIFSWAHAFSAVAVAVIVSALAVLFVVAAWNA